MASVSRKATAACGAVLLGMCAATATAAELSYGVDGGVGYTDNVRRVPQGEQNDTMTSVGGQLSLDHESARTTATVTSRLEYHDYLENSYASEVQGNFIGDGKFDLVKDHLAWLLSDTFGQTTRNQLSPSTPTNRESVNYLSTGPDFSLPIGSRNMFILSGRYIDVSHEDSALDSNRVFGQLTLRRELSAGSRLSLNASTEQVSYDDQTQFGDFDHDEAYVGYEVNAARTNLSLVLGMTEISSDAGNDDDWLGRFKITRQASTALSVGLELAHEFSDSGDAFVQQQALQPGSTDPVSVQQTAAPFLNESALIFADYSRNRTTLGARVGYYNETYVDQPLFNRKRLTLELDLRRSLSASLTAHVDATYSQQDYSGISRTFGELDATVGLRWLLGRSTSLSIDYSYFDRNDDDSTAEYRANEIWLRLGYLVGEGVTGRMSSGT